MSQLILEAFFHACAKVWTKMVVQRRKDFCPACLENNQDLDHLCQKEWSPDTASACLNHYWLKIVSSISLQEIYQEFQQTLLGPDHHKFSAITRDEVLEFFGTSPALNALYHKDTWEIITKYTFDTGGTCDLQHLSPDDVVRLLQMQL